MVFLAMSTAIIFLVRQKLFLHFLLYVFWCQGYPRGYGKFIILTKSFTDACILRENRILKLVCDLQHFFQARLHLQNWTCSFCRLYTPKTSLKYAKSKKLPKIFLKGPRRCPRCQNGDLGVVWISKSGLRILI